MMFQKGITPRQAHLNIPEGLYEDEHGREGFFGPVSHLYRTHRPTDWIAIDGPLKPQAFNGHKVPMSTATDAVMGRSPVLYNEDVTLLISRPSTSMNYYFRNGDGDEIYFVHRGHGRMETDFGSLDYRVGDYLVLPRGTTYRVLPESDETFFLVIESKSRIQQPDRGLLGLHALYDQTVITIPEPQALPDEGRDWVVLIKRLNQFTKVTYPFNPVDVAGWKGDLTAWKLNILDFCPIMSHRAHLAPSVHSTFLGQGFVVCSFVPRPLETEPGAMKVPFYHRNIDYDEVLFYHDGDFFSRDGIDAGMITFHPQGIHHGPHPKAMEASKTKTETDEVAVMVDTYRPLHVTPEAQQAEWAEYHMSWRVPQPSR